MMATNSGYSRVETEAELYPNEYHDENLGQFDIPEAAVEVVLSEKQLKRLWWRNAMINLFFIAAWCALNSCNIKYTETYVNDISKVYHCHCTLSLQQVDVLTRSLWLYMAHVCNYAAHDRAVRLCCAYTKSLTFYVPAAT